MKKAMLFVVLSAVMLTTAVAPTISAASTPSQTQSRVSATTPSIPPLVTYKNATVSTSSFSTTVLYKGSQVNPTFLPVSVIKKLITNSIRYGGNLLGDILNLLSKDAADWVKRNSSRVADFLDDLTAWTVEPIRFGLVSLGMPPADALILAEWIVFFIA